MVLSRLYHAVDSCSEADLGASRAVRGILKTRGFRTLKQPLSYPTKLNVGSLQGRNRTWVALICWRLVVRWGNQAQKPSTVDIVG